MLGTFARVIFHGNRDERVIALLDIVPEFCLGQQQGVAGLEFGALGRGVPSMALRMASAESGCSDMRESARSRAASVAALRLHAADRAAIAIMKRMARFLIWSVTGRCWESGHATACPYSWEQSYTKAPSITIIQQMYASKI